MKVTWTVIEEMASEDSLMILVMFTRATGSMTRYQIFSFKPQTSLLLKFSAFSSQFHGQGAYTFPNGDRYDGDWVDGKKQGYGMIFFVKHVHS
jgi:hypothetical protein